MKGDAVGGQVFAGMVDDVLADKIAGHAAETTENERAASVFPEPEPEVTPPEEKKSAGAPSREKSRGVSPAVILTVIAVLVVIGLASELARRLRGK